MMNPNTDKTIIQEQATAWWVRVDSGDLSKAEQVEFLQWQKAHPAHRVAFEEVCRLWGELDELKSHRKPAKLPLAAPVKKSFWNWQYGTALLATACLLLLLVNPLSILLRADFSTGIGETRKLQLADGSSVYLNSDSALAVNITPTSRQLNLLKGEAFFNVSPDRERPFSVLAGKGTTTALGTAFNIRNLAEGAEISVTEHSVAVSFNGDTPAIVSEGQRVSYAENTGPGRPSEVDAHSVTAWQRGKFIFQNKPLGEVIAELNRYHRGLLRITDSGIVDQRVSGVFRIDQPLIVVNALEKSLNLHSTRLTDYVVLLHR